MNAHNSNQQNHQYSRNQNEKPQALVAVPSSGVVPVVSEAPTDSSNSGSSTVNTAKPIRPKIVIKDHTNNKVVEIGHSTLSLNSFSKLIFLGILMV